MRLFLELNIYPCNYIHQLILLPPPALAFLTSGLATMKKDLNKYWRRNLTYVLSLLVVWFLVSYGAGILFKDALGSLGFWFAQQGSIYVFVVLIFVYVYLMNRLDRAYDLDEE